MLIHCSYHKCLTVYVHRVFSVLCNRVFPFRGGYRHFASFADRFYDGADQLCIASVNNHYIDGSRFGDYRISRLIRDPRDLVVSGYFYHKRGAEPWCTVVNPSPERWRVVNGVLPEGLADSGQSYAELLQSLDLEAGLKAEIDFRAAHFRSMMEWPKNDPRVRLWRYEDMVGREAEVFSELFEFYEMPWLVRKVGRQLADYWSLSRQQRRAPLRRRQASRWDVSRHARQETGGWEEYFTSAVSGYLEHRHPGLLQRYGYA